MRISFLGTAVSRRRRRGIIVLHERVVLQRIGFLVGFLAELLLLGNLGELDAVVVGGRRDANHDKTEEDNTDRCDSGYDLL